MASTQSCPLQFVSFSSAVHPGKQTKYVPKIFFFSSAELQLWTDGKGAYLGGLSYHLTGLAVKLAVYKRRRVFSSINELTPIK
jgi:hypothetical protein